MKKIIRKIIIFFKGECFVKGHKWKMQHDGWRLNEKWDPDHPLGFNQPECMTKKWIYYECKRCGVHGE